MVTLHQAIDTTRKILKWGGIALGSLLVVITLFRGGIFVKEYFFPTPAPSPTVTFGVLPALTLPQNVTKKNFTYSINTVSGSLPNFSDRVNIYQISREEANLLDLRRTRAVAKALDIDSNETRVAPTVYSWTTVDLFSRKLVMDIVSRNFIYTSAFLSYEPLTLSRQFIDELSAKDEARKFLTSASSFPSDIATAKTKTSLYKIGEGKLSSVKNIADTQIIRVDFFLEDIDKSPILSSNPMTSPINLLVSNFNGGTVVEANYYHHSVTKVSATYPIKTAKEAFDELENGKAYIASAFNTETGSVKIRNVFLAYYLSDEAIDYLMPIIVFTDNDGFYAYVSAISDNWIKR